MYCYTKSEISKVSGNILFLGDSISDDGRYVSFLNTWLKLYAPNSDIIINNIGTSSETVSGLSEPDHPFPRPCLLSRIERALDTLKPDWVIMCYGINDGIYYPFSEERLAAFKDGCRKAIAAVKRRGARVVIMTPPPFDAVSFTAGGNELQPYGLEKYSYMAVYENYNEVMCRYAKWIREELCKEADTGVDAVIDIYTALFEDTAAKRIQLPEYIAGDGIHPNLHGHFVMARTILREFFGVYEDFGEKCLSLDDFAVVLLQHKYDMLKHYNLKETIGHDSPWKSEYLKGDELKVALDNAQRDIDAYISAHPALFDYSDTWKGFERHILHFEGYEVIVAKPAQAAPDSPWAWRTEFFGAFPSADLALLKKGWHIVQLTISHQFGCPEAVETMERFYSFVTQHYGLYRKAAMLGFSRGGLYAVHYAATYPAHTLALYLDAPVVDIRSWPGGSPDFLWDWERCLKAFKLTAETADEFDEILKKAFVKITDASLPIIMVAGDSDTVVPFTENGRLLLDACAGALAPPLVTCILKSGCGHHPHSLEDPAPIIDFLTGCFKRDISFVFPIDGDVLFEQADGELRDDRLYTSVIISAPSSANSASGASTVTVNGIPALPVENEKGLLRAVVPIDSYRNILELRDEAGLYKSIVVFWFKGGYMGYRMSVDDVIISLEDIYKNKYTSIFENPFFEMFKRLHDTLATPVQFHIYYQNDDGSFNLSMFPDCYKSEFEANSDWLRLTFHSFKDKPQSPYKYADYETVMREGRMVEREIRRFAGDKCMSWVAAEHWGDSNRLATRAFRSLGYKVLQGFFVRDKTGNPIVSYYLNDEQLLHFSTRDFWADTAEDIIYVKADIVINNTPLDEIVPHLEQVYSVKTDRAFMNMMTHEQYFYRSSGLYDPSYEKSVFTACEWADKKGYRPMFISEFGFEK